ncbi:FHA domain-containing protein [Streptomyces sp. NPDC093252]|uniref:FHA domain-containing protein n=1 Tax=Streptomyces sp. NPDC093252 TaxID=3154980 RepID=UPI00343EE4EE
MQIRLTVVDPLGPPSAETRGRTARCDVLVTAPAGTALAAVASALAAAVAGEAGADRGPVVLFSGAERLDTQRCTLGEPPLVDGAVLSVGAPADPEPHPELDDAPARLDVIAGPDAGGVHLLHGGQVTVGRSADADVPLDDPDVSRLHCAVTLAADGRAAVADLGSTNGTALDGRRVGPRAVRFAPGALLRIGESALRIAPPGGLGARMRTEPDGEGYVRVAPPVPGAGSGSSPGGSPGPGAVPPGGDPVPGAGEARVTHATAGWEAPGAQEHAPVEPPIVPGQGGAPRVESRPGGFIGGSGGSGGSGEASGHTGSGGHESGYGGAYEDGYAGGREGGYGDAPGAGGPDGPGGGARRRGPGGVPDPRGASSPAREGDTHGAGLGTGAGSSARRDTPPRGTDSPASAPSPGPRRRGLSAWARRLAGGRGEPEQGGSTPYDDEAPHARGTVPETTSPGAPGTPGAPGGVPLPDTWPDPAALLLTALGPGPRLWERAPGHPEALTVRLGTADRRAPDGSGLLPAVPVTADLREAGALGLAGPRPRLAGLARAVLAQLAALHSPDGLEIVLISADRSRTVRERTAEWSWLGWLPQVRPRHGQDCRLLLAYDREQAAARLEELLRGMEERLADGTVRYDLPAREGTGTHRPSWAAADPDGDTGGAGGTGVPGPYTVVVVDGDPGGSGLRDALARLCAEGPRAGIHVLCLAETAAATGSAPAAEMFEAACAAVPVFRECGAVALLGGEVATALRLLRVAGDGPGRGTLGQGTSAAVDAVSLAWAERFARALAPLRPEGSGGERHTRMSAPLPQTARLLDELGLARATPASLMARWADAADDRQAVGGRAWAVLGAGARGPVGVDLVAEGPHLLIEGPSGSGRTELLRAVVASLAAAERPDRLGMILIDGRDGVGTGGGPADGLRVCTELPHVTTHLTVNDPVRMREFAQSLSAELKRRAELVGRTDFTGWHAGQAALAGHSGYAGAGMPGRIVPQRMPQGAGHGDTGPGGRSDGHLPTSAPESSSASPSGDIDTPPSSTLRLRPAAARRRTEAPPPLPRLVVVVDDLDALVSPALGSPGRPAAGSVMRALEAVAREGERLGVHLVSAAHPGGRTADTEPVRRAALRVELEAPLEGPEEPAPGRGRLLGGESRGTAFQGGRVTGRIPRTATLRPTVVPVEWERAGDPPTRRPVRELGNGPTDLALLASALERAAREVSAPEVPSLL